MKKILLLALPLMVMCFASCAKVDNVWVTDDYGWKESWTDDSPIIQFKDPKFLNALLNVFYSDGYYPAIPVDRNGDGQISEKEAAVTTEISEALVNAGIRDMSEIKYFTSLTVLNCAGNQLTSLDVSMCRDLERLACVEVDYSGFANYDTQLPLESLKIYKFNVIEDKYIKATEEVYGDVLEYVE